MELKSILATDCGSTTTKAILIEFVDGDDLNVNIGTVTITGDASFELTGSDLTVGI